MKFLLKIFLLVSITLSACSSPDEETRLREALDGLIKGVEDKSFFQVKNYISDDFKTKRFRDIQQVKAFMLVYFRQNKVIKIFTSNVKISLLHDKADMTFNALVTGSSNWIPERGRSFEVKSRWLKQGDDWKISRVNWQEQTAFH